MLYNYVYFTNDGCFRGLDFGISFRKFSNEFKDKALDGFLVLPVVDTSLLPSKYLDSNYWKTSQNQKDFNDISKRLFGIKRSRK